MTDDQRTKMLAALRERMTALRAKDPAARSITVQLAAGEVEFEIPVMDVRRRTPAPATAPDVEAQPSQRAVGEMDEGEMAPDEPTEDVPMPDVRLRGIASSTSVDWYGTEMTRGRLDGMAAQFRTGVDLLPRHHGFLSSVEWDEVLGRTDSATLLSGPVADPAMPNEPGFRLEIEAACPGKQPKVRDLVARLDAGQPIGLSIGGWFRAVQYVWGPDADPEWDDPERILVQEVELEHLAVVRSPANPDSTSLQALRSLMGARSRPTVPQVVAPDATPAAPETRTTAAPVEYVSTNTPSPAVPDQRSSNMDPNEILAAITGLNNTITALSTRIEAIDARTAPAATPAVVPAATPAPTDDRVAKLEAELTRMKAETARRDNVIADLASGARAIKVDAEYHLDDEDGRKSALRSRIVRAREIGQTPTVATIAERHIDALATNPQDVPGSMGIPSEGGERARRNRASLPNILRAICNAADRDGFFNYDANELRGWS